MIDKGQWWEFGQDTGVTPLLFTRRAMWFLMTTESQDLGLTSVRKTFFLIVLFSLDESVLWIMESLKFKIKTSKQWIWFG